MQKTRILMNLLVEKDICILHIVYYFVCANAVGMHWRLLSIPWRRDEA